MKRGSNIKERISSSWELDHIHISYNIIDYSSFDKVTSRTDGEFVRLHFGLKGSYDFSYLQLNESFSLAGHHNNIMYSNGLEIEVFNKSKQIETFGINFRPETFIKIAQNGNETLKRFTDQVLNRKNTILSSHWKTNSFKIQQVINEIINCSYSDALKDLFLLSKSIELLVYQAELYQAEKPNSSIKAKKDRLKLLEAKEYLDLNIENPPTIMVLSKKIGLNEYKLKKGFKELFRTTIFGYIHQTRMELAKQLLLHTDQTAKEIAYQTGYSSPQHFSTAFKKEYGITPNRIRKNPDFVINRIDKPSNCRT